MSMDPTQFAQQLVSFADMIEQQGWPLWGKEACRILWDLLPSEHKKVLATTKCYRAVQSEKFICKNKGTPMGQYPGMLDTLRARFGVGSNRPELGTAASRNYFQGESETSSAFADRVYVAFARDLGTDTDKWHSKDEAVLRPEIPGWPHIHRLQLGRD